MFLVTGATGNVGAEVVGALTAADQQVRALVRSGTAPPVCRPASRPSPAT